MPAAAELHSLSPALSVWQVYDPAVKADFCSTAFRLNDRLLLVDPIALQASAFNELTRDAAIWSIVITNVNHARSAKSFQEKTGAAILASAVTASMLRHLEILALSPGDLVGEAVEVIGIEGAAEGEIALHCREEGGALVLGDALINFGADGFSLLPAKYCTDQNELRRSLRQLLDFRFERLLFAHGTPIVTSARRRLEALLADR